VRLEQKERVVERLTERIREAPAMIVTDYRGLTVTQVAEVRRQLREAGATFHVTKNTLARIAATQADRPDLVALLEGPTAIAFVEAEGDPVAVAKALADTAKNTNVLTLRGGILSGRSLTGDDVAELAKLPAPDVVKSQLVGVIVAPLTQLVGLLTAPVRDLVGLLDARIEQLGGAPAEPETTADAEASTEPQTSAEPVAEAAEEPALEVPDIPEAAIEEPAEAEETESADTPETEEE